MPRERLDKAARSGQGVAGHSPMVPVPPASEGARLLPGPPCRRLHRRAARQGRDVDSEAEWMRLTSFGMTVRP